jgi:thymidylate synthase
MSSQYETDYAALIADIMINGDNRPTRNHPTKAVFGRMLTVHELRWGQFPILSGRKMYPKGVFGELAAFLKGPKSVEDFQKEGCNYWNKWADDDGTIRVDYGNSWLDFNGVNQLEAVLTSLSEDPNGRRHIISGWRPDHLGSLSLPCCHLLYQWYVNGDSLEMIWYQRSVDTMIGLPSDVVLAAAWNILMANQLGLNPGTLTFMLGDTHIYKSHFPDVTDYLDMLPHTSGECPDYFHEGDIYDFNKDSISLIAYDPFHPIQFELH